ncbi:high-affinity branched-chain amino acid transport ATP-binding protein LivF [bacterium BMS3Abin02]|nr:high-affinity branched-chain amino acid transport ATP-binding protein LivF [bacterium BMS3Abin02]GBE23395.1 high-affinity branched-chain amino acid transport ATP-binding protein LivF [bacterium BMS3Bbin01]HDH26710.1 ABC transporter ATP-binding protein [Actinomycetota bacterium]HDK45760.1 ABC transporter ATP-binding protein [Actinomycetota bacterium]HDL48677.1 ABC transporter ATP-binding protein [Actinomycetota bacterium]
MLEVANLEVVYHDVILVLRGISFTVPEGRIVALLGANGAGKTTVLRAISGLLDVYDGDITKGEITVDGAPIHRAEAADIVRRGVTQVMEGRRIFAEFTVEENLRVGGHTSRGSLEDRLERVFGLFPLLKARRKLIAGYLSGGEQQLLAMGRALITDPKYLLLDEPSLGLAPLLVQQVRDLIVEINRQGTGILLVEQNAAMALSIAGHGYIMETGKIVMDKPASELMQDQDVQEFYLGLHGPGGEHKSFRDVKHYKRRKRWLS